MNINLTSMFMVFTIIPFIFLFVASIKLYKVKNIPGSKLIFISLFVAPFFETEEERFIVEMLVSVIDLILISIGAFGFWRLVNHIASANKAIKKDVRPIN